MFINREIFYFFNSLAGKSPFIDSVIVFLGNTLPFILIAFAVVYLLFIRKNPMRFTMIFLVVLCSAAVTEFLKWVVFREPRPFMALSDVTQLINIESFGSFPSQHATIFAALATGIYIYDRRMGTVFIVCAVLIGLARIAAGIHYPFDILTGFAVGFAIAYFSYIALRTLSRRIREYIS